MDFYWHYSGKETIDDAGKFNFIRAIKVGKQVFAALTEYIQVSIYTPQPMRYIELRLQSADTQLFIELCIFLSSSM